jgi:uncharacterized protein YndB with AHSA1/START domain
MFENLLVACFIAALLISVLLAYASSKPDVFSVERSAVIAAPADKVFALINDFHAWQTWSPWAAKDLAAKAEFSGSPKGMGAGFAWDGNRQVGKGRMEIVESVPAERVAIKLDFEKPFEGHNKAVFTLAPDSGGTRVQWVMTGPMPLISKVMCSFMDMDKMIGRDFEAGLENMRRVAEGAGGEA